MTEEKLDYSDENILTMLLFVQKKICEFEPDDSQINHLSSLLVNKEFVDALFLIRKTIWMKCEEPKRKGSNTDSANWEEMKITKSSQTANDGFRYSETAEKTLLKWENGDTFFGRPNLIDELESVSIPNKGFFLDGANSENVKKYRYRNEIDHVVTRLMLVLMSRNCPKASTKYPANHGTRPGQFQENLYSLAGCKPTI